jgi:hypothetical protein
MGNRDPITLWDFGSEPEIHVSYSYQHPFSMYALTSASEPGMAVAADRNPWIKNDAAEARITGGSYNPDGGREGIQEGNAVAHQEDGQNVLFMDGSMRFEDKFFCGINEDNIYTFYVDPEQEDIRYGTMPEPQSTDITPGDREDSYIVHDGEGVKAPPKGRPCFLGDTLVWVDGTLTQISKVVAGQTVNKVFCAVTDHIEKVEAHDGIFLCRDVTLENGDCISVVAAHCFMHESGRWVPAQNLLSGMKLKTMNGSVTVKSVVVRAMPYVGTVYNLKISNMDQYMIGKDGVIVRDF